MLVLTRKIGERIVIDNNIVVEVVSIQGNRIRLGIQAPTSVNVLREELRGTEIEADAPTTCVQAH